MGPPHQGYSDSESVLSRSVSQLCPSGNIVRREMNWTRIAAVGTIGALIRLRQGYGGQGEHSQRSTPMLLRSTRVACISLFGLLVASAAFAQGTLTGLVRDSSGAVLPGVTVEAASPALIEKTRTTVTDTSGQY